jgi:hypothetical protein
MCSGSCRATGDQQGSQAELAKFLARLKLLEVRQGLAIWWASWSGLPSRMPVSASTSVSACWPFLVVLFGFAYAMKKREFWKDIK